MNKITILLFLLIFLLSACVRSQPAALPAETILSPTEKSNPIQKEITASEENKQPTPIKKSPEQSEPNADVIYVRAVWEGNGLWTFYVTVEHPVTGWEDYADGWNVVLPDGTILKTNPDNPFTRLLTHPHQEEQPFTRSQSGLFIPEDVTQVMVQAHDIVDGFGGQEILVDLEMTSGLGFEVER